MHTQLQGIQHHSGLHKVPWCKPIWKLPVRQLQSKQAWKLCTSPIWVSAHYRIHSPKLWSQTAFRLFSSSIFSQSWSLSGQMNVKFTFWGLQAVYLLPIQAPSGLITFYGNYTCEERVKHPHPKIGTCFCRWWIAACIAAVSFHSTQ